MSPLARPRDHRRFARRVLACLGTVAVLALWVGPASGHALIETTEPVAESVVEQAPERVVLRFTEPVEAAFGAVRVYDTAGERVDEGDAGHVPGEADAVQVSLREDLPEGTYTVSWRIVSADGHPIGEAFVFHVGEPDADADGALRRMVEGEAGAGRLPGLVHGLARFTLFAGLVLLIGAWAFVPLVAAPVGAATDALRARRDRLLRAGWWLAVAATLVGLVAQTAVAAGLPLHQALRPRLLVELLSTRYGLVGAARLALLAVAAVAWRPRRVERARRLSALLALALAATPGLAGHAGALRPMALHVAVDAVHVAAAAVWLGGLVLLLRALRAAPAAALVRRFSGVARAAVAVLVVTGVARSVMEVGALSALLTTGYGITLLVKLGVFVPLLALAAANRFWVQPRLDEATGTDDAGRRLRRTVGGEVVLGVVVLAVTAVLVNLPPAKVEAGLAGPLVTEVAIGEGTAQIVVDPNTVGENIVHVTLLGPDARPMDVEGVTVRFRQPAREIGPIEAEGVKLGPGHFAAQGRQLSVPGDWVLQVVARVDRFTDVTADVAVRVR